MPVIPMQQRNDTAANWTSINPTLREAEIGHESDTGKTKIGDGATAWTGLAYWNPSGSSGGGVSIGGDLGGTDGSPQVISTHLSAPLPVVQGGSANAYQVPGSAAVYPVVLQPAKWCLVNNDVLGGTNPMTGLPYRPLTNYVYDNKTIMYRASNSVNNSAAVTSKTMQVPSSVVVGDFLVLTVGVTQNTSQVPKVVATSGNTWTQLGSALTSTLDGYTTGGAVFTRVATSSDIGDTLTLSAISGAAVYLSGAITALPNATGVNAYATSTPSVPVSSAAFPNVTTTVNGCVYLYVSAASDNSTSASIQPTTADPYAFNLVNTTSNGNDSMISWSAQWWPSGTTRGANIDLNVPDSGATACLWTIALTPASGYDGSASPTVSSTVNGVLSIDGGSPAVNDRVALTDPYADGGSAVNAPEGIYTVTNVGSVSTSWVLTRSSDMNTSALLDRFWVVGITDGATWNGATMKVVCMDTYGDGHGNYAPYVMGWTFPGITTTQYTSIGAGQQGSAQGFNSSAFGTQSVAVGQNATALGNTAVASGQTSMALGAYSIASGEYASTIGYKSYASGITATALGTGTNAYAPGMSSVAGQQWNNPGDMQSSVTIVGNETTNATPSLFGLAFNKLWIFEDWNGPGHTDWSKTMLVKVTVVARRTDTPGTDSVWTAQGVLRGDGSSSYTWVGGSAPTFTVVAQDSGASTWSVAVAVNNSQPGLTLTATGAASETILWLGQIETVELSSSTA